MTVFEVTAVSAWNDWSSRGSDTRIGLFGSLEKAEARVKEMKKDKEWKMSWSSININAVKVN
jgi:hypothetical protein